MPEAFLCADFGSTWTKVHLVEPDGGLLGFAAQPTTVDTDVMEGFESCVRELVRADDRAETAEVLACSSAGGGLRMAVIGTEMLVTAEAGQRVAMSSGGRIVHVVAGTSWSPRELHLSAPDAVLLVGGTDGGDAGVAVANARRLSASAWKGPVVVACNIEAQAEIRELLETAGVPVILAANVMPRIGRLEPHGARAAIREAFIGHVIGGKGLSERLDFREIVLGATPDIVLLAVELLSLGHSELGLRGLGELAVVDIGGATTDVYSVVTVDAEDAGLDREVVATTPASRTVEGDLGMRWSAPSTIRAAARAALISEADSDGARSTGEQLERNPERLPTTQGAREFDGWLASLGIALGLRRHAGRARVEVGASGRIVERSGKDLRDVSVIIASGGAVRHATSIEAMVSRFSSSDGGWQLPESPRIVGDKRAVLSVAGLLSLRSPKAAYNLLVKELSPAVCVPDKLNDTQPVHV